jgi:hypothetical protein
MPPSTALATAPIALTRVVGLGRSRAGGTVLVLDGNGVEHHCTSALELWDALGRILDDATLEDVTASVSAEPKAKSGTPMQRAIDAILGAGRKHLDKRIGPELAEAVSTVGGEAVAKSSGLLSRLSTRGGATVGRSHRR